MKKPITLCLFAFLTFSFATAQTSVSFSAQNGRTRFAFNGQQHTIHLYGLIPGREYEVLLRPEIPCAVHALNAAQTGPVIKFVPATSSFDLQVEKECSEPVFTWLSASITTTDIYPAATANPTAVLQVSSGLTGEELIQGVLIGNNCSVNLNVQQKGDAVQFGTFTDGMASVGFDSGIIISTGNINNAPGPNNSGGAGVNVPGNNTDPDLNAIASDDTYDAAVLEFDFTPTSDKIEFEYVFASEEYCEFVNNNYNDVFGFFISGPGIPGTVNIARVPTTNEVVNIDNINHLKNQAFFNPNSYTSCSATTNMIDIEFDGYTVPLKATATVIPCETYHIKLAIADVGDGIYDSAVFLKAGSFNAGDIVQVTPKSTILQVQNSYEGCDNGYLVFDRSCTNDLTQPLTLTINVLPTSTAQAGIDYQPLPQTVIIPANVQKDSIPIIAFADGLTEGDETIEIEVTGQYPCYKPTATVVISDETTLSATGTDLTICPNDSVTLQPTITGALGQTQIVWENGSTQSVFKDAFAASDLVTCTVSDECGHQSTAEFNIEVIEPATGEISGDAVLCDSTSSATIQLNFTGSPPWDVVIEKDNSAFFSKTYTNASSSFDVNQPGVYRIQQIFSSGCPGIPVGEAQITNSTLTASFQTQDVSCFGESDGSITAVPANGTPPYQFAWTNNASSSDKLEGLPAGDYGFTITDANGCTASRQVTVTQPQVLTWTVDSLSHTNCYFPQGGSIHTSATGGTQPYSYAWSQGATTASVLNLPQGEYSGIITDANGCQDSVHVTIEGDFEAPLAQIQPPDTINCYRPEIKLSSFGSSTGPDFDYAWATTGGHISSGSDTPEPLVDQSGIYRLTVTNVLNGCTASASVSVLSDFTQPPAEAGPDKLLTCTDTIARIGAPNPSQNLVYQWITQGGHFVQAMDQSQTVVDAAGSYVVLVTDLNNGCTNQDTVWVEAVTTRPESATIDKTDPTCLDFDGVVSIVSVTGGTSPYVYSFDNGLTFITESTFQGLPAGIYHLVIQDVYGCEYRDSVKLYAPVPPTLSPVENYIIELGDSVRLVANSSIPVDLLDTIIWEPVPDTACPQCLNPYAKPLETTDYYLTIIDKLHCQAQARIKVMVQDPGVYIPNVFAPQSPSGANDRFTVFGDPKNLTKVNYLYIFDRWGNQVFSRRDFPPNQYAFGWDGTSRSKDSPAGVYIYVTEVEFINGTTKVYQGDVTLVR